MFFDDDRIVEFRRLILVAETVRKQKDINGVDTLEELKKVAKDLSSIEQYEKALAALMPLQKEDFKGMF